MAFLRMSSYADPAATRHHADHAPEHMKDASSPVPNVEIRPPWPDEIPRLKGFLRGAFRLAPEGTRVLVLGARDPERLLGAAVFSPSAGETAPTMFTGSLGLRPRALAAGHGSLLLRRVVEEVRKLQGRRLAFAAASRDAVGTLLESEGFSCSRTEEFWRLDLARIQARLERIAARFRLDASLRVRAARMEDRDPLIPLVTHYGLCEAHKIQFQDARCAHEGGYDCGLSSVVEHKGRIVGALLIRGSGGLTGHADVRAVAGEYLQKSGQLNFLLLQRSVSAALREGYQNSTLTVNPGRDAETRALAMRSGGVLCDSRSVWEINLDGPRPVA
jgi:GNAT superfamily N-acetyltransferase